MDKAKLNALLAVHLFGWVERPDGTMRSVLGDAWQDPEGNILWEPDDWAGTWEGLGQVVEAMEAKGYELNLWPTAAQFGPKHKAWNSVAFKGYAELLGHKGNVALAALRSVAPEAAREVE